MKLVIVESPTKANTIKKYLPKDYQVLATRGHVRDLPSKAGSVDPEANFTMHYDVIPRAAAQLKKITEAASECDEVLLATDPDREGEAISWHIMKLLQQKRKLKQLQFARITFHEITNTAIKEALASPSEVNVNLVDAQQARRALDYLVGFEISPILWRKLPGTSSAGRVQSVALRMICDREDEREAFQIQEYWTIHANFQLHDEHVYTADLQVSAGKKLAAMAIKTQQQADAIKLACEGGNYSCQQVKKRNLTKQPPVPFITSTLQQEGVTKLGLSPSRLMQIAQQLYEGVNVGDEVRGLITYMRTDSPRLSKPFVTNLRTWIKQEYGDAYVQTAPYNYKNKVKNAQEAHECIRPTDCQMKPEAIRSKLTDQQFAVYDLIWRKTVASQMTEAIHQLTTAEIASEDQQFIFVVTSQKQLFPGFTKLVNNHKPQGQQLDLIQGTKFSKFQLSTKQHATEPPARFSEASLVKALETKGIGRPSTYAPIMELLIRRQYTSLRNRHFYPEPAGRLVTSFLEEFFADYVSYNFTAGMEEKLDDVANGELQWRQVMKEFWEDFHLRTEQVMAMDRRTVLETVEKALSQAIFSEREGDACPECKTGKLRIKPAKTAVFLGCSNYPECKHTEPLFKKGFVEQLVYEHPPTQTVIFLRQGPFGYYLQLNKENNLVKRLSLPASFKLETLTTELAQYLLSLPKELGTHSTNNLPVAVKWGVFGGYLNCGKISVSISKIEKLSSISLQEAETLINNKELALKKSELGEHPEGGIVSLRKIGRQRFLLHQEQKIKVAPGEKVDLKVAIKLLAANKKKPAAKKTRNPRAITKKKPT